MHERADLAELLATLSPEQWQAPTLCAGWRVRDVVAHVVGYDELGRRSLLTDVVEGRLRPARINVITPARYDTYTQEQLLALLKQHLKPRGLPAALGGRVALVEVLFHHQDIRRPLGLPRTVPAPTPAPTQSSTGPAGSRFWTRHPGVRVHLI